MGKEEIIEMDIQDSPYFTEPKVCVKNVKASWRSRYLKSEQAKQMTNYSYF